jgi:hypothetical protein
MLQYLWLGLAVRFLRSECYSPECVEGDSANFALKLSEKSQVRANLLAIRRLIAT